MYLLALTQQDQDGDNVVEVDDNCMFTSNPSQDDLDGDLVGPPCDCDDNNAAVTPAADEQCSNGIDDDCDGLADGDDPDCGGGYSAVANANAAAYGSSSLIGSGTVNELVLLMVPLGAVVLLRIVRRRKR